LLTRAGRPERDERATESGSSFFESRPQNRPIPPEESYFEPL
jgi:hypothetical protein